MLTESHSTGKCSCGSRDSRAGEDSGPLPAIYQLCGLHCFVPTHACHPHSYRSMIKKSTTMVPDSSQDLVVSREQSYPGVILWGEQWSVTPDPVTTNDLSVGQSFVSPLVGPLVSAPHQGHCGGLDETPPPQQTQVCWRCYLWRFKRCSLAGGSMPPRGGL